jgi:putative addiction module component (TIGR02574 family)
MATTFAALGMGGLTAEEKLDLVGDLWDDLATNAPPGGLLTDGQRAELRRRVADAKDNPDDWVAWEDALAATRKRLAQ